MEREAVMVASARIAVEADGRIRWMHGVNVVETPRFGEMIRKWREGIRGLLRKECG